MNRQNTLHRTYTLDGLCTLAELPKRTVRYYIQLGLVDRPVGETRAAHYTSHHLEQLLQIRKWSEAGVSLERVKTPADYPGPPREALAQFLARFMQSALHGPAIQMSRMSIGVASRFPDGAAQYFEVVFQSVTERTAAFLRGHFRLTPRAAHDAANALLGRILVPRFLRALFAVDPLPPAIPLPPDTPPLSSSDLGLARELIAEIIEPLLKD